MYTNTIRKTIPFFPYLSIKKKNPMIKKHQTLKLSIHFLSLLIVNTSLSQNTASLPCEIVKGENNKFAIKSKSELVTGFDFDTIILAKSYDYDNDSYFDWDYGFFLEIMRFKLSRMRHNHETKQIIEAWQEVANEIKEAEVIIGRLIEWDSPEAFNADLQLLSDHLKKHLQGWWD